MEYREICHVMGYRITRTLESKPTFHIRNANGEIVSRGYDSPDTPLELMRVFKEDRYLLSEL